MRAPTLSYFPRWPRLLLAVLAALLGCLRHPAFMHELFLVELGRQLQAPVAVGVADGAAAGKLLAALLLAPPVEEELEEDGVVRVGATGGAVAPRQLDFQVRLAHRNNSCRPASKAARSKAAGSQPEQMPWLSEPDSPRTACTISRT